MFSKHTLLGAFAFLLTAGPAVAQETWQGDRPGLILAQSSDARSRAIERERTEAAADEVRALVYSPEFIMENRRVISLSDRQRDQMVADLQHLQSLLLSKQTQMEDARAALIAAMQNQPADQSRVLAALDQVLDIERDVKRLQMQALLRLRDALTPAQRAQLNQLRSPTQ